MSTHNPCNASLHARMHSWAALTTLPPLLIILLLCTLTPPASAQRCNMTMWRDEFFTVPYNPFDPPQFVDGDEVCVLLIVDTNDAPCNSYDVTIRKITMCTGTTQNLIPGDPDNPGTTGCNTPIVSGEILRNVLYDSAHPNEQLAIYDPQLSLSMGHVYPNRASFCFLSKAITPWINVLQVDWVYNATSTANCIEVQALGCDGIEGSGAVLDQCGVCRIPTGNNGSTVTFTGTVRDFNSLRNPNFSIAANGHPDFEYTIFSDTGIPSDTLVGGANGYITYGAHPNGTLTTHNASRFSQWYTSVPGVNIVIPLSITLNLVPGSLTMYRYVNDSFFPIDNQGWGNQGRNHNFHFTYEIRLDFTYVAGAGHSFNFTGDDDLWVFVNGKLVIDLGGVHGAEDASFNPDLNASSLGLVPNQTYNMVVYFAERHTTQSEFAITTNLAFGCTCLDACGVCGGDGSTCATTAPPPTTTPPPPPTTTPPPPTTTEPPTTTPLPTTVPPPTPSPTTPPPPTPTSGNGSCYGLYVVDCTPPSLYVHTIGCTKPPKPSEDSSLLLSILALVSGFVFCVLLALFALLTQRRRPTKVTQKVDVEYIDDETTTTATAPPPAKGNRNAQQQQRRQQQQQQLSAAW